MKSKPLAWMLLALPALAQDAPNLTIRCDLACVVEVDGAATGQLSPQQKLDLRLTPGEHSIVVRTQVPQTPEWRKTVRLSSALPVQLEAPLRSHLSGLEIAKVGYWKDNGSGLAWAPADNGSGVTASQGKSYCAKLRLAHLTWRLPGIHELPALFGGPQDERGFRVVAPLQLTGWAWSATPGNEPGEFWAFDFADGAKASVAAGDAGLNRALCVADIVASAGPQR